MSRDWDAECFIWRNDPARVAQMMISAAGLGANARRSPGPGTESEVDADRLVLGAGESQRWSEMKAEPLVDLLHGEVESVDEHGLAIAPDTLQSLTEAGGLADWRIGGLAEAGESLWPTQQLKVLQLLKTQTQTQTQTQTAASNQQAQCVVACAGRLRLSTADGMLVRAPGRYDGKGCFSNEANQGCSWLRIILLVLAGMAPPFVGAW
ncbi:predicted protein [Pyrenophora tritici-repentis Pt-1C-BFP]|uniref:Uncharacterized protein n=1 Tax=Pyrenophora tritici-repentis (strain Pt-1C-BFP) TaxID=426418 RepID=B2VRQ3_PYRTR|nr:uncharacterized protein PTRG_00165 [Pyrenophora tritici-repentis Pt-1C-BFP]EDU39603.1 predicted protein [Pyrenophora tritici-repentis Pt-1C-BFP]